MDANISDDSISNLAEVFHLLGQPNRMRILLVIGQEDACVCHIEAVLGIRQATISQHLKVLRDTGVVTSERNGRNVFYRLAVPELYDTIARVAALTGIDRVDLAQLSQKPVMDCPCPFCNPGQDPELSCQKITHRI